MDIKRIYKFFLNLISCEKEQVIQEQQITPQESSVQARQYGFNELIQSSNTFKKTYAKFNKELRKINERDESNLRSTPNEYGFIIDTTKIIELTRGGKATYTLRVYRDEPTPGMFENVVIRTDSLYQLEAYLLKYYHEGDTYGDVGYEHTLEIEKINYSSLLREGELICSDVTEWYCTYQDNNQSNPCGGSPHQAGLGCWNKANENTQCTYPVNGGPDCVFVPGGSFGGDGYNGDDNLHNGGGGNGNDDGVDTSPIPDPPCDDEVHGCDKTPGEYLVEELPLTDPDDIFYIETNNNVASKLKSFREENLNYDAFLIELIGIIKYDPIVDEDALDFVLKAKEQNKIYNDIDSSFLQSVNQFTNLDLSITDDHNPIITHFMIKMAVLRALNPEWSDIKIFWEATKDVIHITLDGIGLIPVVGELADFLNGGLYLLEGDGVNASLSFAATVPIFGWTATGAKYAVKLTNTVTGQTTKLVWKVVNNVIDFGRSSQLRKVLGLLPGNPQQAHHLVPWALRNNPVVQKAANSIYTFHMNDVMNGIAVAAWRNQPNHNLYNQRVQALFDALPQSLTPDEAFEQVNNIVTNIRNAIINNPNTHLNDLIF